jgi:hypothetical protein
MELGKLGFVGFWTPLLSTTLLSLYDTKVLGAVMSFDNPQLAEGVWGTRSPIPHGNIVGRRVDSSFVSTRSDSVRPSESS